MNEIPMPEGSIGRWFNVGRFEVHLFVPTHARTLDECTAFVAPEVPIGAEREHYIEVLQAAFRDTREQIIAQCRAIVVGHA